MSEECQGFPWLSAHEACNLHGGESTCVPCDACREMRQVSLVYIVRLLLQEAADTVPLPTHLHVESWGHTVHGEHLLWKQLEREAGHDVQRWCLVTEACRSPTLTHTLPTCSTLSIRPASVVHCAHKAVLYASHNATHGSFDW